jgi:hypothetical protein
MVKRGRGRPRKIKTLEQYTLSELRDMPMGSMLKLFVNDLLGKKSVVVTSSQMVPTKIQITEEKDDKRKEKPIDNEKMAEILEMPLEKKADYLADALMGYLKKTNR